MIDPEADEGALDDRQFPWVVLPGVALLQPLVHPGPGHRLGGAALLPPHPLYAPAHPLSCHRPRIADRIIFGKLIQVLRFGCSYESIADCDRGATTIRERRDEWIKAGIFAKLKRSPGTPMTASSAWS